MSAIYDILPEELYEYDANGNRRAYETGKNNQLTSGGVFRYTYDGEGNRVAKVSKNSRTEYFWDHRNRLVRVLDNGKSIEYGYDYQNRLVRRNDELFVHDGWQVACSLKNGRIAHRYLWGAVQDELLAMDDNWALRDHLNTVRKVVDVKGGVISTLEYNAFGKLVSSTGDKPLFRYTGKMFDDATGLQWNINRWYDAQVGRWCSEDPIGFRGKDENLFCYVANSPLISTDSSGLILVSSGCHKFVNLSSKVESFIAEANKRLDKPECQQWFRDRGFNGPTWASPDRTVVCHGLRSCKIACLRGDLAWTYPFAAIELCVNQIGDNDSIGEWAWILIHELGHHFCTWGFGREDCADSAANACL